MRTASASGGQPGGQGRALRWSRSAPLIVALAMAMPPPLEPAALRGGAAERRETRGRERQSRPAPERSSRPSIGPAFSREFAAGIEWLESIPGPTPLVLVGTADGHAHALAPPDGRELLPQPLHGLPGIRPVPWSDATEPAAETGDAADTQPAGRLAWCFDRFSLYALRLDPPPELHWSARPWAAPPQAPGGELDPRLYGGDPENLRNLVAVLATPAGVLVGRDDGRLGLLERADGRLRWTRLLGTPLSAARLHARGDTAALVWKEGPAVVAAVFDVRGGFWRRLVLPDERAWPVWSALAAAGLVVVYPDQVVVCPADQPARVYSLGDGGGAVLAAAVALYRGSGRQGAGEALVFGRTGGTVSRLDLTSGEIRWNVRGAAQEAPWATLTIGGDAVLATRRDGAAVIDLRSGSVLTEYSAPRGMHLLDAAVRDRRAYFLLSDENGEPAQLRLAWRGLGTPAVGDADNAASPPATRDDGASARPAVGAADDLVRLGPAGVFLDAAWLDGWLIVAQRAGLRGYELP